MASNSQQRERPGEMYEVCLATLIYLRVSNETSEFSIEACPGDVAALDDLLVSYKDQESEEHKLFLQLKHKTNNPVIHEEEFFKRTGDFSLLKYFDSFCQIQDKRDNCQFILYTNAGVKHEPCTNAELIKEPCKHIMDEFLKNIITSSSKGQISCFKKEYVVEAFHDLMKYKDVLQAVQPFLQQLLCCNSAITKKKHMEVLECITNITNETINLREFLKKLQVQPPQELNDEFWDKLLTKLSPISNQLKELLGINEATELSERLRMLEIQTSQDINATFWERFSKKFHRFHNQAAKMIELCLRQFKDLHHHKRLFKNFKAINIKNFQEKLEAQLSEELNMVSWEQFLNKFHLFSCQASEQELNEEIKKTLHTYEGTDAKFPDLKMDMTHWRNSEIGYAITHVHPPGTNGREIHGPSRRYETIMNDFMYRVGVTTFIFLKSVFKISTGKFSFDRKLKSEGAFGDLKFSYVDECSTTNTFSFHLKYVREKNKQTSKPVIKEKSLCAQNGEFSVLRYFESFCHIHKHSSQPSSTNSKFIFHTNASLEWNSSQNTFNNELSDFCNIDGKLTCFQEKDEKEKIYEAFKGLDEYKDILKCLSHTTLEEKDKMLTKFANRIYHCSQLRGVIKDQEKFDDKLNFQLNNVFDDNNWNHFINQFYVFSNQASLEKLDYEMKHILHQKIGKDQQFSTLKYEILEWLRLDGEPLLTCSLLWDNIMRKHILRLEEPLAIELNYLSWLEFIDTINWENFGRVCFLEEEPMELSCRWIQQCTAECIMVDYASLMSHSKEVLAFWEYAPECRVLVIAGVENKALDSCIVKDVASILKRRNNKQLIVISNISLKIPREMDNFKPRKMSRSFSFNQLKADSKSVISDYKPKCKQCRLRDMVLNESDLQLIVATGADVINLAKGLL